MQPKKDLYEMLGVSRSATSKEIRTAYQKASLKHHPDKSSDPRAHEKMQELNDAKEVLVNPCRRKFYDETGSTSEKERERLPAQSASKPQVSSGSGGYCASCGTNHSGDCGRRFNFKPAHPGCQARQCCECDSPETNREHFMLPCGCCFWCFQCAYLSFQEQYEQVFVWCKCGLCHDIKLEQVKEFIPAWLYKECQHILRPTCVYCGNETTLLTMSQCKHSWCTRCTINRFNRAIRPPGCCGCELTYELIQQRLPHPVATLYSLKKDAFFRNWESPSVWPKEKAAAKLWEQRNPSIVFGQEAAALLSTKDKQIKELEDEIAKKETGSDAAAKKARISELEADIFEIKGQNQNLRKQLAAANRKAFAAQNSASDTRSNQDPKLLQKDCTNKDHIEALKAKDIEIKRLAHGQKLALDGEHLAKMARYKAEEKTKRLQEQFGQGRGKGKGRGRHGPGLKPNDAVVDNRVPKLENENHDLRARLAQSQRELSASTQRQSKSTDEVDILTKQLARVQEELSAAQKSAAKTATDHVTALESENHDLRGEVGDIQAELNDARDAQSRATKSKCQAGEEVMRLQSQLAKLKKKPSTTQAISDTQTKDASSRLQFQLKTLNKQVIQLQVELTTARLGEQSASQREAAAKDEAESFRIQLAEARKARIKVRAFEQAAEERESETNTTESEAYIDADKLRIDAEAEINALRGQLQQATKAQKTAEDEASKLRTEVKESKVDSKAASSDTSSGNSTAKDAANNTKSEPSLDLLRGQLLYAKELTRSAQDEKARSIAETIRLRDELADHRRAQLDAARYVRESEQVFKTLQAKLEETKKHLRKYTDDGEEPREATIGADDKTRQKNKNGAHLRIQTTQLVTLEEKDKEIEELRIKAGRAQIKLTSTILEKHDEIKRLKTALKLAENTPKASTRETSSASSQVNQAPDNEATYTNRDSSVPCMTHVPDEQTQALLHAEAAKLAQDFHTAHRQRFEAFNQLQLDRSRLQDRHPELVKLERAVFEDQQDLRVRHFHAKKDLIKRTRLAEYWLKATIQKQNEIQAKTQEEKSKETLAERRKGKMKAKVEVAEDEL